MLAPPRSQDEPETGEMERAEAFETLALQPSADTSLVEIGYWCLVELAHVADLPERERRKRIAALNDARTALTASEVVVATPARVPKARVPRPRAPVWAIAVSLLILVAVPTVALALLRREAASDQTRLIAGIGAAIVGLLLARAFWIRVPPVLPEVHLSAEQARAQLRLTADAPPPLRVLSHQYLRRRALLAEDYSAVRAVDAAAALLRRPPPAAAAETASLSPVAVAIDETAPPAAIDGQDGASAPVVSPRSRPDPEPAVAVEAEIARSDAVKSSSEAVAASEQAVDPATVLPPVSDLPVPLEASEAIPVEVFADPPVAVAAVAALAPIEPVEDAPEEPVGALAVEPDAAVEPNLTTEPVAVLPPAVSGAAEAGTALLLLRGTIRLGEVALENGRVYTIGSGRGADIKLADHGADEEAPVATEHARLTVRRGRVLFHHVGEQFESKVNGIATEWAVIEPGDEIEIGNYILRCEAGAA